MSRTSTPQSGTSGLGTILVVTVLLVAWLSPPTAHGQNYSGQNYTGQNHTGQDFSGRTLQQDSFQQSTDYQGESSVDQLLGGAPVSSAPVASQATLRATGSAANSGLPVSLPAVHQDYPAPRNFNNDSRQTNPANSVGTPSTFELPLQGTPGNYPSIGTAANPARDHSLVTQPAAYHPPLGSAANPHNLSTRLASDLSTGNQQNSSAFSNDLLDQPINSSPSRAKSQESTVPGLGGKATLITQTILALTIVLALVVVCAWLFKKAAPKSMQGLPSESIQVLGNAPLTSKQHLKLVRLGNRLLLLAVSDAHSQTLAEVSDPDEVRHLLELIKGKDANSAQQTFRSLLSESEKDRATGFLGSQQDQVLRHESKTSRSALSKSALDKSALRSNSANASRPVSLHTFEA